MGEEGWGGGKGELSVAMASNRTKCKTIHKGTYFSPTGMLKYEWQAWLGFTVFFLPFQFLTKCHCYVSSWVIISGQGVGFIQIV